MKRTTKKSLMIACVSLLVLVVLGAALFRFAVDRMFLKVTQTIGEQGLLNSVSVGEENPQDAQEDILLPSVDTTGDGQKARLDAETVKMLQQKVSASDKLAVLSLLAKALPQQEYSRLLSFAGNGVSQEEMSTAIQVLRQHLSKEDKQQIKQYYAKYLHLLEN